MSQRKKQRKETVRKKTFIKRSCSHDFDVKVDSNNNVTRVNCKICLLNLPELQVEASGREFHGIVLALLSKYADGLDYTREENIDKHGKSGDQHWQFYLKI